MHRTGTYGTDLEIRVLAHLLNTNVSVYEARRKDWVVYTPSFIDPAMSDDIAAESMYLHNPTNHFEVVLSTE